MTSRALAPHTARNCEPILEVLETEFAKATSVLEIGSGNGQHATTFAAALSYLTWQTSDREQNHPDIQSWLASKRLANVYDPLSLDVLSGEIPAARYDAVFSANTAHIMSLTGVEKMFDLAGRVLSAGGVFCLYGPFRQNGKFNADSNAGFHRSLRSQDMEMGIRHLENLDRFAASGGMRRSKLYAMPANNFIAVWQQTKSAKDDNA